MKTSPISFKRSLTATLAGLMLLPASVSLFSIQDSLAGGVAVRGPRGGGAAVRGPARAPARGPAYRGPSSVHGTARRTSRRTARRTTRRLSTLPRGYSPYVYGGVTYYTVGGRYYEPVYEGSTVVYVEVVFED